MRGGHGFCQGLEDVERDPEGRDPAGAQTGGFRHGLQGMATRVRDFLAQKVCPATKEEESLKQMWDAGTPDEKRVLAALIFKMVQ